MSTELPQSMVSYSHRDLSNLAPLLDSLPIPFAERASLSADAGSGARMSTAILTQSGVLVSRFRCLSLHAYDLSSEHWRIPVPEAPSLVRNGHRVFAGADKNVIVELDCESGTVLRKTASDTGGILDAVAEDVFILTDGGDAVGVGVDGRTLWRRTGLSRPMAVTGTVTVLLESFVEVVCIETSTGSVHWSFSIPVDPEARDVKRSRMVHDIAVIGDAVVLVTASGLVYRLRVDDGALLARARAPFLGRPLVTRSAVFFAQPFGLSEFDHERMVEVSRSEYSDVEPSAIIALCVARDAVVWTTLQGRVMGSVRSSEERREPIRWSYSVAGRGEMQTNAAPFYRAPYLYLPLIGSSALICFEAHMSDTAQADDRRSGEHHGNRH